VVQPISISTVAQPKIAAAAEIQENLLMRRLPVAVLLVSSLLSHFLAAQTHSPADAEKQADSILSKMTLEEKIDYIGGYKDFYIRAVPRLGLPAFKMADGPVGIRNYGPSTALAGGIALAASWDPALVRRAAEVLGEDGRARGVHFLLGPGVNIYRAPMNGRNFEYFGEDPFLASRTAVAYIEGLQSQEVCATIKHFMGNNSEYDRHNVDSLIDERTMREIYLPTFEAAVKEAHVCAIMDSYNLTNGQHMTQNGYLNIEVAKKEWGFDGIMMSDWDGTYDGVAAANGGLDLEMPSGKFMNRANLLPAVKDGSLSEATLDEHVRRILRKAIQMGWLDREQTDPSISLYNPAGRKISLEAARSSMVLLKNDGKLLPLEKSRIKTLAVIGPDAYPAAPVGGGSARVQPFSAIDYMEGLANYLGSGAKVLYKSGIPTLSNMAHDTVYATKASGDTKGLRAEFFESNDLSGTPVTRTQPDLNYGADHQLPSDFHSARWTGYYVAKDAGAFHVVLQSTGEQGGSRVFLDDKVVFDNWTIHKSISNDAVLNLSAGPHQVRVEAYRKSNWGNTTLRLGIANSDSLVDTETLSIAAKADAVVLAVGFDPTTETEGADRSFRLPPGQDELIQAVLTANKKVIIVVTSGGGVDMTRWIDQAPALLQSWYSGQEGGTALAQLLFGDYSPSGKLPVTFERQFEDNPVFHSYYPNAGDKKIEYSEGVLVGYRGYDKSGVKPLFPFGFGLSYTTFKFSNLKVIKQGDGAEASFDITTSGAREGAEVAELYVGEANASVPRPAKELKGFTKVALKPGETRAVSIPLNRRAFAYYDIADKHWKVDPQEFGILVGDSSDNLPLKGSVNLGR
jgi:beta-glucosidase